MSQRCSGSVARATTKHAAQALIVRGGMLAWEAAGLAIERADQLIRERAGQRQ